MATRQPTLRQLKYLVQLADVGHFGNAATACHVSQSTLSAGIQELEDVLGVSLVERNNRQVILTLVGRELVSRARTILMDVDDLTTLCAASSEPFTGKLRLGVIPTIAPFVLPGLLKRLRKEHPEFQLYIREDLSGRLVQSLNAGDVDVLLLALPFAAQNTETMYLFSDRFSLVCAESHRLGQVESIRVEELRNQELLLLEDGHCLRDHVLEACRLREADISVPYQATSLSTIVQMVANGIGVTLLPEMALNANILSGIDVHVVQLDDASVSRSIGLMWRRRTPRRAEFTLLGDFIRLAYTGSPD